MPKTKEVLITLIATMVLASAASNAQAMNAKPRKTPRTLEHIVLINLSGKAREARVGNTVVPLPVAQRVALEVAPGENIKITSSTDQTIARVITAAANDGGRTIPID